MVYYRRNLLVLSITAFLTACCWNQLVPFLPLFIKELGVKDGLSFWAGVMLSAQTIAAIVMAPYWGKLADKYGRKLMIIRAGICGVLIYLGMSYCRTLWQLLLLQVLVGVLTGFIPASLTLVATNTPKSTAARYVAIVQSILAIGTIAGPILGSILVIWVSYRGTMLVSSIVVAMAVILVVLLVEERRKISTHSQPTSLWQDFRLAFKNPLLAMALYSDLTCSFVMMGSQPILILYIQELAELGANLFIGPIFALPALAIVLTNYCWSRLGDRYTVQRIILFGLIGVGCFTLLQGMAPNIWWFAATYFLAGVFAAAVRPNTAGLIATKVETDFQGRAYAIQQSSQNFGRFIAPLLTGSLGSILSLRWVFIVVGSLGLIAATAIRLINRANGHCETPPGLSGGCSM